MSPSTLSLLILVGAYLFGALSGERLLGRLRGVDLQEQGSGGGNGIDALRAPGWKFVFGAVVFDLVKGALAAWLALRYAPTGAALSVTAHGYAAAFAALLGHAWPLWHGFRGGKGATTLFGGLAVLWPWSIPLLLLVWLATFLLSGYIALASVLAGAALALLAWWSEAAQPRLWFAIGAAALLLFTHRGPLLRMRAGSESRFGSLRLLQRLRGSRSP